jgi:hypothetical protein
MSKTEQQCALAYAVFSAVMLALVLVYLSKGSSNATFLLIGWAGVCLVAAIIKAYIDGQHQQKSDNGSPSKKSNR